MPYRNITYTRTKKGYRAERARARRSAREAMGKRGAKSLAKGGSGYVIEGHHEIDGGFWGGL